MSGYAKRAFDNYVITTTSSLYKIIKKDILPTLPSNYDFDYIYNLLQELYPYEIRSFEFNLKSFEHQDRTLQKIHNRKRYKVKSARLYLANTSGIKYILNKRFMEKRSASLNEEERQLAYQTLLIKRAKALKKMNLKVKKARDKAQQVEPFFLDQLIGLYERKGAIQKDRVYMMHELYNYDCPKVTNFMSKVLVHEQNFQLREMALKHLQDYGYNPILRRKDSIPIKNKKKKEKIKAYRDEKFSIEGIPDELEYLIDNSKVEDLKEYEYFISHSSTDYVAVQRIIRELNQSGKYVYCDWINDSDYLKRNLLCDATLKVLENRIQKSKSVLFVDSKNSRNSVWVAYELQFAEQQGKKIMFIDKDNDISSIKENVDYWYQNIEIDKEKLVNQGKGER